MAEEKIYPFIPFNSWWKLRKELKRSIPKIKVDGKLIAGLIGGGMKADYAAWNIIPQLKRVKLLDENNLFDKDLSHKFREDSSYKEFCEITIKSIYPESLSIVAETAKSNNEDVLQEVKKWFSDDTKKGEASTRNFATFYLLLKEGDYTKAAELQKPSKPKTKIEKPITVKESGKKKEEANKPITSTPTSLKIPDMNINVQIHISADSTTEQIENIFKYMSKYLYNKE
jgi:hypothetical protein